MDYSVKRNAAPNLILKSAGNEGTLAEKARHQAEHCPGHAKSPDGEPASGELRCANLSTALCQAYPTIFVLCVLTGNLFG